MAKNKKAVAQTKADSKALNWAFSILDPQQNILGQVLVIAETKEKAVEKIQRAFPIEGGR